MGCESPASSACADGWKAPGEWFASRTPRSRRYAFHDRTGLSLYVGALCSLTQHTPKRLKELAIILLAVTGLAAAAQTPRPATPPARFIEHDATRDLNRWPVGPVDLTGLSVMPGKGGSLHTMSGSYRDIGTGSTGPLFSGGAVHSLVVATDGTLYVRTWKTVYRREGDRWIQLGEPVPPSSLDAVYSMTLGPDGALYAGIRLFRHREGEDGLVVRWTGSFWAQVGPTLPAPVDRLAFGPDGTLYAAGYFTEEGVAGRVARWTGSAWVPLPGLTDLVTALGVAPDGTLYAGWGRSSGQISRWDGAAWAPLGGPANGDVRTLSFGEAGALYVGGSFTTIGGVAASRVARWDGAAWDPLGAGLSDTVADLAWAPSRGLYAVGAFQSGGIRAIARWDGAAWAPVGSGTNGILQAVAVGPDGMVYAGGEASHFGAVPVSNIGRWDGMAWHPLGNGIDAPVWALARAPDGTFYAGGAFTTVGDVVACGVARWDGHAWHPLGSRGAANPSECRVSSLAVAPDGTLYAGYAGSVSGVERGVYRWDDTTWTLLGGAFDGHVSSLAVAPDGTLYAGGGFRYAGTVAATNIARWDGTAWHALGSGIDWTHPDGWVVSVHALAVAVDGTLYAGGNFGSAGGVEAHGIAAWDGAAWAPLGTGVRYGSWPGTVFALAFEPTGTLYVGGQFLVAGGVSGTYNVARYLPDERRWSNLHGGVNDPVRALAVSADGVVYVGGDFTAVGSRVARWTSEQWSAVGSGVDGTVLALAAGDEGDLLMGGAFTAAGGLHSRYVTLYETTRSPPPPPPPTEQPPAAWTLTVGPNPARGTATVRFTAPAVESVTVAVYDVLGRTVATLFAGEAEVGQHEVTLLASALPAGAYVIRIAGVGTHAAQRFTVVR